MIDGVFDHQDSHGGGGTITNGDTQWMTAGSGILHIETPPEWLVQSGGLFHGIQLWVNLPRDEKLVDAEVPGHPLRPGRAPHVVRRGRRWSASSPARSARRPAPVRRTPRWRSCTRPIEPGARLDLPWDNEFNALVYVLNGEGPSAPTRGRSTAASPRCSASATS